MKNRITHIFTFLLLSLVSLTSYGQKMSIASFKIDEADLSANVEPTMRFDMNGDKCALIKVETTQKNFTFDVGSLGIVGTEPQNENHPGEIWVYVQPGAMKITIQHPVFGIIKDYDLGGRLKSAKTYNMVLTSDEVNTMVVDYDNRQFLDIEVEPSNAEFFMNGAQLILNNGHGSIQLAFGTHNYRVTAKDYHPEASQVTINDKENKQRLKVRLKQAFGYLTVNSTAESKGGELYVDDVKVGKLPVDKFPLSSGMHKISVLNDLYFPYSEQVAITDSGYVSLTPILKPNYAEYEIQVDGDKNAIIYDNGTKIGTGSWKGRLEAGEHIIAASKKNHETQTQKIIVVKDEPRKVSLAKPMPICGLLEITTNPSGASVYLDGSSKAVGTTPYINNSILIGAHHVRLELAGHKTVEFNVEIKEGELTRKREELVGYYSGTIYSTPEANLYINGILDSRTPSRIRRVAGTYQITLKAHGYSTLTKKVKLDGNSGNMTFKLQRNYTRPNEFYIQAGFNFLSEQSFNAGAGFYLRNFNLEMNYVMWLKKSEKIWWNDKTGKIDPFTATYTPSGYNAKFGYGVRLHSRIRVTPQIGALYVTLKESAESVSLPSSWSSSYYSSSYTGVKDANVLSLSGGVRCNVALIPWLGLSITPEYRYGIVKSDGFKALSKASSQIKSYAEGFNCNASINFYF